MTRPVSSFPEPPAGAARLPAAEGRAGDFEQALQRAGHARVRHRPDDEAGERLPDPLPFAAPPPLRAALRPDDAGAADPLPPAAPAAHRPPPADESTGARPGSQAPQTAMQFHVAQRLAPPAAGTPAVVRVELGGTRAPLQAIELQPLPTGGIGLALNAEARLHAPLNAAAPRLRERLAVGGTRLAGLVLHGSERDDDDHRPRETAR